MNETLEQKQARERQEKRDKMWATEVQLPRCENCDQCTVIDGGLCFQCGHHQGIIGAAE